MGSWHCVETSENRAFGVEQEVTMCQKLFQQKMSKAVPVGRGSKARCPKVF